VNVAHLSRVLRRAFNRTGWDFHRYVPEGSSGHPLRYENIAMFLYYRNVFEMTHGLEGDVVECGVGSGSSFLFLTWLIRSEMRGRKLWGFDSFEGFPEPSLHDQSSRNPQKGEWNWASIEGIRETLRRGGLDDEFIRTQTTLIKGFFDESLVKYRGERIAFLHLDCDLHDSYKVCLETLYPKVCKGGAILFDEYMNTFEHHRFPGAQKAIDTFLGDRIRWIKRDPTAGKYYMIKMEE
jgi:O-methyltransferase